MAKILQMEMFITKLRDAVLAEKVLRFSGAARKRVTSTD